jgi:hypothetical protein
VTYGVGQAQYVAVIVGLRNNHVNDLSRRHAALRKSRGEASEPPRGGAAVWVFSL